MKMRSQSVIEYAIFIAVVVAAILAMQTFFKRAVMGRMKSSVDMVGYGQYEPGVMIESTYIEEGGAQ
jgi:hypothetical protein